MIYRALFSRDGNIQSMSGRLKDSVAVVLGAGSSGPAWGNGKATAVLFAREGAKVFGVDTHREAVEETSKLIRDEDGDVKTFTGGMSNANDVKSLVDECVKT
jgi:NAD(P)-dependent dehydrogenase (short-subunit alcohol dehydrogenase family)